MTAVKSLSTAGSSAACAGRAPKAMVKRIAAQSCVRRFIFSSSKSERLELDRIRQKVPEHFARRRDISSERRVFVLKERHHLKNQKIVALAKLCERRPAPPCMERTEPGE